MLLVCWNYYFRFALAACKENFIFSSQMQLHFNVFLVSWRRVVLPRLVLLLHNANNSCRLCLIMCEERHHCWSHLQKALRQDKRRNDALNFRHVCVNFAIYMMHANVSNENWKKDFATTTRAKWRSAQDTVTEIMQTNYALETWH